MFYHTSCGGVCGSKYPYYINFNCVFYEHLWPVKILSRGVSHCSLRSRLVESIGSSFQIPKYICQIFV
jgi:hypothetical protein